MSREELEEKGWRWKSQWLNEDNYEKGDVWKDDGQGVFLKVSEGKIKLTTTDKGFNQDGPNYSVKYNGKCKNVEQFDMICEMIEFKLKQR